MLQLKNNYIIDESLDIMIWALPENDDWMIIPIKQQIELINNNDSKFKPWLDKYKYYDRFPNYSREFYQSKCGEFLDKYNNMLLSHSFLLGNSLMFADVAIFPFIRQCAHVDPKWFENKFPNLNEWLTNWKSLDIFLSVMNKYQYWNPNNNPEIVNFNK